MKTPLGTEVDLGPYHIVLDGVSAPAKGAPHPPSFRPMWSPISATAELLYKQLAKNESFSIYIYNFSTEFILQMYIIAQTYTVFTVL